MENKYFIKDDLYAIEASLETYPLKKRKIKKEVPAEDNFGGLVSIFGNIFPQSTRDQWINYPGAGWVHNEEDGKFHETFFLCNITRRYFNNNQSKAATGGNGHIICLDEAIKLGWKKCQKTQRWVPAEDIITVKDGLHKEYQVASNLVRLTHCDHYNIDVMSDHVLSVKDSKKYIYVCKKAVLETDLFKECDSCKNLFETGRVRPRLNIDIPGNCCDKCYIKRKKADIILKHDCKNYPAAIISKQSRLGHREENGVIWATGEKEEYINDRLFGVEVELEIDLEGAKKKNQDRLSLAINIKDALGDDFVITKEDGTLQMNGKYSDIEGNGSLYAGFEIVSAPADLDTHKQRWNNLQEIQGYDLLRAWHTDTCGFHVHVSKEALSPLQIDKIVYFVNKPKNQKFIFEVAGRDSDKFCRYYEKNFTDSLHPDRIISKEEKEARNRSRRVAVNVSNPDTIEFRIFRGTIKPRHIIRNLEFVDAVCDYCHPYLYSMLQMKDYKHFIDYVDANRKKWPMFAEWLAKKYYIPKTKITKKTQVDKLTLRLDLIDEVEAPPKREAPPQAAAENPRPLAENRKPVPQNILIKPVL